MWTIHFKVWIIQFVDYILQTVLSTLQTFRLYRLYNVYRNEVYAFKKSLVIQLRLGLVCFEDFTSLLTICQSYRDLEARDTRSLTSKVARLGFEPGPLTPQVKSLTTPPLPLPVDLGYKMLRSTYCQ